MEKLEKGDGNTCVGYGSATRLIEGYKNTMVGVYASGWHEGANATTKCYFDNTCAFGANTLNYNITGTRNNVFGAFALHQSNSDDNCAFGYYSFYNLTTGSHNVGYGNNTGTKITTGSNNVFIGDSAGSGVGQKVDAVGTTVIGAGANSTRSNEVVIGKNTDTHVTLAGVTFTKEQLQALLALVSA